MTFIVIGLVLYVALALFGWSLCAIAGRSQRN
jgi:hypothetical protein